MAVDTETLYPFSGVDTQRITEAGFEIPRQNGDSATLTFNEVSQEWKFNRGDLKLNSEPDEGTDTSQVLLRNSNTGKIEQISSDKLVDAGIDIVGGDDIDTSYNSSLDEYTIDLEDEIDVNFLTLDQNKTQDNSGDIQIRDESSGDLFSLDDGNSPQLKAAYEGNGAFTFGYSDNSDEPFSVTRTVSVVLNGTNSFPNFASSLSSFVTGAGSLAAGPASSSIGFRNNVHVFSSTITGFWADDYLFSADPDDNPSTNSRSYSEIVDSDRIFRVGVGEDPDASSGDAFYYDGRGRVDGLYVTMRDGTHVRHGLSVDGYNDSLGQYETVFEVDSTGTIVKGSLSASVATSVDPAGPDDAVQFNDNQDFGGSGDLTWDGSSLTVNGKYQLTDSTGTYDAVDFESGASDDYYVSGTFSKIATKSSTELYIGATTPSKLPTSGVGDGNFVIGSGALGKNATIDSTLEFSHISGNFSFWGSNIDNSTKAELMLVGYGSGYSTTFDNATNPPSNSDIRFTAIGNFSASSSDFTQCNNTTAVGYASMYNVTGDYGYTTALGYGSLRGSTDITDSTAVGSFVLKETQNIQGSFFLGNWAGTSNIQGSGGAYAQPDGITGSIVIANSGIATKDHQAVFGAAPEQAPTFDPEISEVVFGRGPFANNPDTVTITTTDVRTGSNINGDKQGGNMVFASGQGTGMGTQSFISFETPNTDANTYDQQSLVERLRIRESGVSVRDTLFNIQGFSSSLGQYENRFEVSQNGSLIQTSGGILVEEDNRNIEYSLNQRTTDGTQKTLKIDSQNADFTPNAQDKATWEFSGKVVARVESGNPSKTNAMNGDSHVWEFEGVFTSRVENASLGTYNVEFIGQPVVSTIATNPEVENYSVDITKNDDGELLINVTGEDGATVNWSGKLEVMELVA